MDQDLLLLKNAAGSESGYYVPSFESIASALDLPEGRLPDKTVSVPTELLRFLIRGWLATQPFDEAAYRAANPDVDAAIKSGLVESGWTHYVTTGYYEGRSPEAYYVDPKYYRRTYPDIALAERRGQITPEEHYAKTGRVEGRYPSQAYARLMLLWREALEPR